MKPYKVSLWVLFLSLFLFSLHLFGQTVSGRLNTSFYSWERLDGSLSTEGGYNTITQARGFQTVRLGISHGDISLQSYSQFSTDFNTTMTDDPLARIYNLHLNWRNIYDVADITVGRQPIFAGVGRGTIDGGSVRFRFPDGIHTLYLYAGSLVTPFQAGKIERFSERRMIGGQFTVRPIDRFNASISYMDRHNKRESYFTTRPDTVLNYIILPIESDTREFQLASIDANYMWDGYATFYGRFDFNVDDSQTQRAELWTRVHLRDDIDLTLEYIYREPLVPWNSYFKIFNVQSNQEIEAGFEYRFSDMVTLTGKVASVLYDGDNNFRFGIGGFSRYGSLSLSRSAGYAGEMNSISLMVYYPVRRDYFVLSGGGTYASYKHSDEDSDMNSALGVIGGASFKFTRNFSFDLQGQYMTNRVYGHDTRIFLRLNYWFFENLGIL